jgi:hypothetical protein
MTRRTSQPETDTSVEIKVRYDWRMPSAVEMAVDTYIRAWGERDATVRGTMIEACFAADGRIVMRGRELRGRAALAEEMATFLANPRLLRVRVSSAIDARGTTFRFRAVVDCSDGTCLESFDAGEIDASGRIAVLLTFAGPLSESPGQDT